MKMFVKKFTASAVFVLLLAITAISGFIGVVSLFNGEYAKIAAEENDNDVVVSTNDNALTFAEMPQTRWYLAAYRLIYAHDDNYSNWTTNAMSTSYSENANRLGAYAINDEFFRLKELMQRAHIDLNQSIHLGLQIISQLSHMLILR